MSAMSNPTGTAEVSRINDIDHNDKAEDLEHTTIKHRQDHLSSDYNRPYSSPQCRPVAASAAILRSSTLESRLTLQVHQLRNINKRSISATNNKPAQAFCHCTDDRKLNNTQVFQIPKAQFSITAGEPKIFTKQSDHGRVSGSRQEFAQLMFHKEVVFISYPQDIHTHFCPNCGTAMFRTGGAMPTDEFVGLRAGVLDNQKILDKAPMMEVYVERRMKWLKPIEGALQMDAQYAVVQ